MNKLQAFVEDLISDNPKKAALAIAGVSFALGIWPGGNLF